MRTLTQNTQANFRHFVRCRMGDLRHGAPRLRSSTVKSGGGCTAHLDAITSTQLSTGSSSRPGPVRRRVFSPAGAVGIPDRGTSYLSSRGALSPASIYERPGHPSREEEFRAGRASRRNLFARGGPSILLRSRDRRIEGRRGSNFLCCQIKHLKLINKPMSV